MKFDSITIRNFRNFEDITIQLTNKNVLFGMNDVGKTNFLYGLRYVFDKDVRKQNFVDTDYYKGNVEAPIEITITIDISDTDDNDCQKLRAKLRGALMSNQNKVYICLKAVYDKKESIGIPVMSWGGSLEALEEMKTRGIYYDIDYVFNPIYIDAYVDLYALFKKNANTLLVNDDESDSGTIEKISQACNDLNTQISNLSGVKKFEEKITPEYKKFRHEDVSISVKSEIAVKGLYSNIVPYIKHGDDESLYPTSGEGRKKLLVYSIYDIISDEEAERKINIFLIEEPENHLHRSMQIALSHILFQDEKYQYLFMTTHSSYVLAEIDDVNLVRIYNKDKITSSSALYQVPKEYKSQRKLLNKGLVESIFFDKVLLVEGPSEVALFSKVLSEINPFYEADGIYILSAGGFGFRPYFQILDELEIKNVVKTDNDLKKVKKSLSKYSVLGFSRINGYLPKKLLPTDQIQARDAHDIAAKWKLYDDNREVLDRIREDYSIHLSHCSLEEDLDEVLHDEMIKYLPDADGDVVGYLQDKKNYHMVELVEKLTHADCVKIYEHYNFACLKEVMA